MNQDTLYSTSEVAERLHVHARTIRKWIDAFSDYVQPQLNNRGHYQLDANGVKALEHIQQQLQAGNTSLKQVREALVKSGALQCNAEPTHHNHDHVAEALSELNARLADMEAVLQDIRNKQDQFKFELRDATFEQRLSAAGEGKEGKSKHKKLGVLRLSQLFR